MNVDFVIVQGLHDEIRKHAEICQADAIGAWAFEMHPVQNQPTANFGCIGNDRDETGRRSDLEDGDTAVRSLISISSGLN